MTAICHWLFFLYVLANEFICFLAECTDLLVTRAHCDLHHAFSASFIHV